MNIFNAPLPGTTLRIITEEWRVLSGFRDLLQQRMKLETDHLLRLRQFQDSIDSTWPKSEVWPLISPVIELWISQTNILEECNKVLASVVKACPTEPSPDEPEEGIIPSSRYKLLYGSYKQYQDCQKAASSREAIIEMREWFKQNHDDRWFQNPLSIIDRNYRESVVAHRNALRPITDGHLTKLPAKLEAHVRDAEETQKCLRDYLVEYSRFTSDLVQSIATSQKRLAEFSSLTFIDSSHRFLENESLHPAFQPAVYVNYWFGESPAEPVLGVLSYLPKLLAGKAIRKGDYSRLSAEDTLRLERESTSADEAIQRLREGYSFNGYEIARLALNTICPLLPVGHDAIRHYKSGIRSSEIAQLLKPFPIEKCRLTAAVMVQVWIMDLGSRPLARWIFGSSDAKQLLEDIWRKWDFDNHRPLPREVVRTLFKWNDRTEKFEGGILVYRKSGLPYNRPR